MFFFFWCKGHRDGDEKLLKSNGDERKTKREKGQKERELQKRRAKAKASK